MDTQDGRSSLARWVLHGALWLVVYCVVFAWGLIGNIWIEESILGFSGRLTTAIAYIAALLLASYWAHRIAAKVVPL